MNLQLDKKVVLLLALSSKWMYPKLELLYTNCKQTFTCFSCCRIKKPRKKGRKRRVVVVVKGAPFTHKMINERACYRQSCNVWGGWLYIAVAAAGQQHLTQSTGIFERIYQENALYLCFGVVTTSSVLHHPVQYRRSSSLRSVVWVVGGLLWSDDDNVEASTHHVST